MRTIREILADNLKRLREQRGLTQETLAERMGKGVSGITVQGYERKRRWIKSQYVTKAAVALGVSEGRLFEDTESLGISADERDLLDLIRGLDDLQRDALLAFIRATFPHSTQKRG